MRLNLFLPDSRPGRGRPGWLAARLRRLAPSWLRTPWRRGVQAACLVLFLALFAYVCRSAPGVLASRERLDAELFLRMDPLAGLAAAAAARAWVGALAVAAVVLAVCLVLPRGFCAYICPLGALIDLFDWLIARRVKALRVLRRGRWARLRFYVLAGVVVAAACGVQLAGWLAAIPLLTRGLHAAFTPAAAAVAGRWDLLPPVGAGGALAAAVLAAVLLLGLLGPRFWCRCLCPTGAVFSLGALARGTDRKVTSACIACGRCLKACSFDAIGTDYTTRGEACTFCQECGAVCPPGAIQFTARWDRPPPRPAGQPGPKDVWLARRGVLAGVVGGLAAGIGLPRIARAGPPPVRPPGSLPEARFLELCVRCGSCLRACPTDLLQPLGFGRGVEGLWTPHAAADHSGCDPRCNHCGQVCPTGAIRPLPLAEKRAVRMGRAAVDERTCLPHAGRDACRLCQETCLHAGHEAIEFLRVGVELDDDGLPVEDSGYLAPVVLPDKCVGCGLCQARCHAINVGQKGLLAGAAIRVEAGEGKDDRIARGSYLALRHAERKAVADSRPAPPATRPGGGYVTDF